MFKEIFLFEFVYRKGRPSTYVYFGIAILLCFLGAASPIIKLGGAVGQIKANSPYVIYRMTLVASFALSIISSAVMSVSILRDYDHDMKSILFSTRIKKWDYLMGRFWGSFTILLIINSGIFLGFMLGFAIGKYLPWEVAWKNEAIFPFNTWSYLHPFLLVQVPNLLLTSALFFMSGALWRNSLVIYAQGIFLIVLYQLANSYLRNLNSQYLAAIIDPFAIQTFLYETRYWSPAQQNTMFIPLEGAMLYNRLLWIGVGLAALGITYKSFSFNTIRSFGKTTAGSAQRESLKEMNETSRLPAVSTNNSSAARQALQLSFFYFKIIWKEIPFMAIAGGGILLLFLNGSRNVSAYGTPVLPTTATMLDVINSSFGLFFVILVIFYSGELIWRERLTKFDQVLDSMPISNFVIAISKFVGLVIVHASLILILIAAGMMLQASRGYFNFELPVYVGTLFSSTWVAMASITLLCMFIQSMAGSKFSGFVISILILIMNALLNQLGFEHDLWQYGSGSLGSFSDMNAYGHFVKPFAWFRVYWASFSGLLFIIGVVFAVRGMETSAKLRWRTGKWLTRSWVILLISMAGVFLFSGAYIYYNTNVINQYQRSDDVQSKQADYERVLKKYKTTLQPRIVETHVRVDLYPANRVVNVRGFYYLKNTSRQSIRDIHVQCHHDPHVVTDSIHFTRKATPRESFPTFRYTVYELTPPMEPGDSIKMTFHLSFEPKGFVEADANTDVVYNGTVLDNTYLPSLAYNQNLELTVDADRKKQALDDRKTLAAQPKDLDRTSSMLGDDADVIRFEAIVSTENDQTVIAPGRLQKQWTLNNRSYFQYRAASIRNNYVVTSGRYSKRREDWHGINLEIYYHPKHEHNLDKMIRGMRDALEYCTSGFSPYGHEQLRIIEIPRYKPSARSWANTVLFSEGREFTLTQNSETDLDMPYYNTVNEIAHQWWGQQIVGADGTGSKLLTEGLSHYVALMVMKRAFGPEATNRYLRYELDRYLRGRTQERNVENPLRLVQDQPYLYASKASLTFFALQNYIGEDRMNAALRAFHNKWARPDVGYPTSDDLLQEIRLITPDTLQYLIQDMFENVTLFENRALEAVYRETINGQNEVIVSSSFEKFRVENSGQTKSIPLNDWIDIGVYGTGADGREKLILLRKYNVMTKEKVISIPVREKPKRVEIDPMHKLIERNLQDNTTEVKNLVEVTNLPLEFNP